MDIFDGLDVSQIETNLANSLKNPIDWKALEREREEAGENRSRSYRNPKKQSNKKPKKWFNRNAYVPK